VTTCPPDDEPPCSSKPVVSIYQNINVTCVYYLFINIPGFICIIHFTLFRMVPVFGVLILVIVYFLPHMGNGPYWKDRIIREVDHCSSSWWTNMLAVNNFVQPEKQVRKCYIETNSVEQISTENRLRKSIFQLNKLHQYF